MSDSTSSSTSALDEMRDLIDFIGHHNAAVRLQACKMVTSLSASESNRALIAQTSMIPALARHMTSTKDISREVFKALINLAENEEIYAQMLKANTIAIAMECLRDSSTDLEMRELILMFLTNMTRDEKGASVLMSEGEEIEGLHVRRLLQWFTAPAPAAAVAPSRPGAPSSAPVVDPNAYIAHILTNITQIAAGRRLLLKAERGYLAMLKPQLSSPHPIRRMGTFQLLKNCFIEEGAHETLLAPQLQLLPALLAPIVGPEPFLHGESEYAGLHPAIRSMNANPDKRRDPDPQIRVLVYEIVLLCAKFKPSRVQLRAGAIYPLLRHAHDAEKEAAKAGDEACAELDHLLEQLVPFFILDEDDNLHPEQIEAEKKRARVEQLKAINAAAPLPGETPEQTKERLKREAEEADKPVHYLGDELGGEVRRREAAEAAKAASSAAAAAAASSAASSSSAASAPAAARSKSTPATVELIEEDETFPDMEPLGAAETLQLGEVKHNVQTLEAAQAAKSAAAAAAAAPAAEPAYAVAQAEDDEDEDDDDGPPPLAEEGYMDGLD